MMNPKYESDHGSTPTTPKCLSYYVQSPSGDSNDYADKSSSSAQNTPTPTTFDSPLESPSYSPSYGADSASSRVSGNLRWARGNRRHSEKGSRECKVIDEELVPDNPYGNGGGYSIIEKGFSIIEKLLIGFAGFSLFFACFCFIVWSASRPYKTLALNVHSFYYGQGSDHTGVPTRLLTVNCSLRMATHNPATFFGIHVSSTAVNLKYSQLTVATGEVDEYYQPSKSHKELTVRLHGHKVPLYGTGTSFVDLDNKGGVPLKLDFEMRSHGYLIGNLVKTKHTRHVSCSLIIKSGMTKHVVLHKKSCTWN
ncbi:PREDICTED: uncharacterized protein LOC109186414 isoform X2 [Ipomoea nil]|uniref:uncharacterized protein LOC109186414 isoform X2 n=1 Tax=Ipomoea nil TaxID=35883 RepID=UPI000901C7E5|nr:PREDICTED: uncharacterized protein LOC109186414 isoform X2 [Ipomoea nil]